MTIKKESEVVVTLTPKGLFEVARRNAKNTDDFLWEVLGFLKRYEMGHKMNGHAAMILLNGELVFGLVGGEAKKGE